MKDLLHKTEDLATRYNGRWAIVVTRLSTGEQIVKNPDMVFPSASMIKVPIMYEIMRQVAAGQLNLDEVLTVPHTACVGGAGILHELRPDIPMTIRELVTLMIIVSDNTATNLLIDYIGMNAVNTAMAGLGLKSTVLQRKMMDFAAARAGRENLITAADMNHLFACILHSTGVPETYGALMLDILKRQQIRDKLPFYLPENTPIAHKTGTLDGVEHDGGLLFLPGGPYSVCVLTADLTVNYQGLNWVADIGKILYEHFTHEHCA